MNKLNKLFKVYLDNRLFRFLIVGVINTIVGYGIFALCIYLGMYYYYAFILSYIIGVANSYIWNKLFTFKSKTKSYMELIRFILVYVFSFVIGSIALYTIVDILKVNEYAAGLINLIFTTAISWFGHNKFSFKTEN